MTRKTCQDLVAFHNYRNWSWFIPGRNAKTSGISKFPEKGQPQEEDWNFWNKFLETFSSIRFWTGISGNFGRVERALLLQGSLREENKISFAADFWKFERLIRFSIHYTLFFLILKYIATHYIHYKMSRKNYWKTHNTSKKVPKCLGLRARDQQVRQWLAF